MFFLNCQNLASNFQFDQLKVNHFFDIDFYSFYLDVGGQASQISEFEADWELFWFLPSQLKAAPFATP